MIFHLLFRPEPEIGGLIVSGLVSRSSGFKVQALGGNFVFVFLGKTLCLRSAFLHPGVFKWVPADNLYARG